jgi:hypothetical protein
VSAVFIAVAYIRSFANAAQFFRHPLGNQKALSRSVSPLH